ncbi:uncharacterized protein LOC120698963 isoform X1 [Panicum virgatum]|uniref:uncharacterized protein LOC120698963 isoform X1 n=1 Tax=Panicum virgatum TaxID=38727 RepID=UPI0019D6ABB7|nr:uncharacterized protein LOC120698963 isoform X1 [Panicum virgatum]
MFQVSNYAILAMHPCRCFIGSERAAASAVKTSAGPSLPVPAPPPPVSLPDNDDILREILLRLPPLPSSLPRASLVCKHWRRLVSDPGFLRRLREHHQTPPLLGYFFSDSGGPVFTPALAPPNCIPPERFSLPEQPAGERLFFLGCRHGLALLINRRRLQATVWDPITNRKVTVAYPPEFTTDNGAHCFRGAVLSSGAGGDGYDGHCLRPFKVILISTHINDGHTSVLMCVYESGTGKWSNTISTIIPSYLFSLPDVLIGDALLCGFFLWPDGILELDLDRHTLGIIQIPTSSLQSHSVADCSLLRVVQTQDRGLGLAVLSKLRIQLWGRKADSDGVARWVLQRTVEVDKLLSLPRSMMANVPARILGYDEDSNAIHLSTSAGAYAFQLESMQFTELFNVYRISGHPYASFYTAGFGNW